MEEIKEFAEQMIEKGAKRKRGFFIRLSVVFLAILLVLLYFLTPCSKVSSFNLRGNHYLTKEKILDILWVNENTYLYQIDEKLSEELLDGYPLINKGEININPFNLDVSIDEISPCFKQGDKIVLNDASFLDEGILENTLVQEELDEIIARLPFILQDLDTYNLNSVKDILLQLTLGFVANCQTSISYIDYIPDESGVDGNFAYYFKASEELKTKLFEGNDGEILFLFKASCVQYYQDHFNDGLVFLASNIKDKFDNLFNQQDLTSAKQSSQNLLGKETSIRTLYIVPEGKDHSLIVKV